MLLRLKKLFNFIPKDTSEESMLSEGEVQQLNMVIMNEEKKEVCSQTGKLSLHETWEKAMDDEQRYILSYTHVSLPEVQPGNVAIAGYQLEAHPNGLAVHGFIRNRLKRPVRFEKITLAIVGADDTIVAKQAFLLGDLGEIPPFSDRPWRFVFLEENVINYHASLERWRIIFYDEPAHKLKLQIDESWKDHLSDKAKEALSKRLIDSPPLMKGKVDIVGIELKKVSDDALSVLLFIRNHRKSSLSLQEMTVGLKNESGQTVATGSFRIDPLRVDSGCAKPWRVIFPKSLIKGSTDDVSRWEVYLIGFNCMV
ncbi:SLAP domain-containing protein [Ammoniphilus sp. CFH 90114]|uniref:SLAP domain-containing protein n=1 Tax=Ammoniphilus sp. CFH 90114 TaxID=2493665 RepID=UPI00100FE3ED|nr:SLAP domain-containing protein [Ammoniphilus sp. CFH 90114]RXT04525.1 SLAP domain-containing protein [Ammoniphilus sp. CFH 90114]